MVEHYTECRTEMVNHSLGGRERSDVYRLKCRKEGGGRDSSKIYKSPAAPPTNSKHGVCFLLNEDFTTTYTSAASKYRPTTRLWLVI